MRYNCIELDNTNRMKQTNEKKTGQLIRQIYTSTR